MSELVEEHTVVSKKLLTALIQGIIVLHVLLLAFDGFPVVLTLFSAASHGIYLLNVSRTFPMGVLQRDKHARWTGLMLRCAEQ